MNGNWLPGVLWATDTEGGEWMPLTVHSLAFENPAVGWGRFARWDRINGFTDLPTPHPRGMGFAPKNEDR
jgi:hypothetical protein